MERKATHNRGTEVEGRRVTGVRVMGERGDYHSYITHTEGQGAGRAVTAPTQSHRLNMLLTPTQHLNHLTTTYETRAARGEGSGRSRSVGAKVTPYRTHCLPTAPRDR